MTEIMIAYSHTGVNSCILPERIEGVGLQYMCYTLKT